MSLKVLVACEESQEVCKALRELGHDAFSCDTQMCSGGHPEWHIQDDVLNVINGNCQFFTSGGGYFLINGGWDLVIAHPPCTDLACSGARWFPEKQKDMRQQKGVVFFMRMILCNAEHIAVENPVGIMSSCYRKPDQIIQPWQFGEPYEKTTCLWLKNLPKLESTEIVEPPPRQQIKGGKSMPEWYSNAQKSERSKIRSKTFPGVAMAMAEQWCEHIEQQDKRRRPFRDQNTIYGWRCGACNVQVAHEQKYCDECGIKLKWENDTEQET